MLKGRSGGTGKAPRFGTSGGAPPPPTDPFWTNVRLLINGNNGFVDASGRHTFAQIGTPTTAGGYIVLDGASGLTALGNLVDFDWTADFTLECAVIFPPTGATTIFLSTYSGGGGTWEAYIRGGGNNVGVYQEGGVFIENAPNILADNTRHWWSMCRLGGTFYEHIDGVPIGNAVSAADWLGPTFAIGYEVDGTDRFVIGQMQGLRLTKGVSRYSAAPYTPPSWPLPTS